MSQETVQVKMSVRVLQVREIESCVVCRCVVVDKCVLIRVEIIHEVPEDHIDLPSTKCLWHFCKDHLKSQYN